MSDDDFGPEPIRGLPETPPEGERILWQGAPDWRSLLWRVFALRWVMVWFALLAAWRAGEMALAGKGVGDILASVAALTPLVLGAAGALALIAWLTARSSVYTLTTRRLAMRVGMLTVTFNIPYTWVGAARLKTYPDGTGDIALATTGDTRLAYLLLWPHARPWHLTRPEPALRCVPQAGQVADLLAGALRGVHAQTEPAAPASARDAGAEPGLVAAE